MAVQELGGFIMSDKSLLPFERSSKQSDVCQASTSSNSNTMLFNNPIETADYFWAAATFAPVR